MAKAIPCQNTWKLLYVTSLGSQNTLGKANQRQNPDILTFCHVIVFCHILWLFPWDILICIRLTVPNSKWRESWLSSHWLIRFTFIFGVSNKPNSVTVISPEPIMVKIWYKEQTFSKMSLTEGSRGPCYPKANTVFYSN